MTPPENDRAKSVNLARKLRPLGFDGIIGQDFVMRMLQNSLYKDQLFPVYLFFGQHGCGKTSTARVFAAAMNCKNLEAFRKNPREHKVPCHNCSSCTSFKNENYPDFIEIDAASHTGVENVRQIIEASSYVPVAGAKRVYLIDEAHMLSKAAFNALLKLLEEPPKSAVFLLATTEIQKVPNTVRSRCFQAPFSVPDRDVLIAHLEKISAQEDITVSRRALEVLVAHTGGFIRD
ncbi:DNA polymerase III subunit gamma/tau, partial [bacterium]|nr:DNA polymerase III subunit gamma/tau [bacterium]